MRASSGKIHNSTKLEPNAVASYSTLVRTSLELLWECMEDSMVTSISKTPQTRNLNSTKRSTGVTQVVSWSTK
jgi:hypothetical protein